MSNWALSIGTGRNQQPLIDIAKKKGYRVIGVDRAQNCDKLDELIQLSTFDTDKVLTRISNWKDAGNISGIMARVSGPAVITAATLARNLNLPTFGFEVAKMSFSKSYLREQATSLKIPTIFGQLCRKPPQKISEGFYVLKPNQPIVGKKNVYKVSYEEKFIDLFEKAKSESIDGAVEFQKFEDGKDIGVCCAFFEGKLIWHIFYEELVKEIDGKFFGAGVSAPVTMGSHGDLAISYIKKIISSSSINGFIFFSFKLLPNAELKIYEMNPGLCGDGIVDQLFAKVFPGHNFYKNDVDLAMGTLPNFPSTVNLKIHSISNELLLK